MAILTNNFHLQLWLGFLCEMAITGYPVCCPLGSTIFC